MNDLVKAPTVTILPAQALRIFAEANQLGTAIGVTQDGTALTLNTGSATFQIGPDGFDIKPE